jgi:hypothetical protein
MAIRRPSIASPEWLFQDFLYQAIPGAEDRYIQVKWSGEPYTRISQSFDYSNPPYVGSEQRGGDIAAQLDYTLTAGLVTVTGWFVNWKDEWPLRLAMNYLSQCLYPSSKGYLIRAMGDEVYKQDGTSIPVPNKDPYAFLVSEQFMPASNEPYDYLLR